jgi:hypothetical protein
MGDKAADILALVAPDQACVHERSSAQLDHKQEQL